MTEKDVNRHVDVNNLRDYNKIVEQMHQEAYQDSQKNKLARIEKMAGLQRRRDLKVLKRKEKE